MILAVAGVLRVISRMGLLMAAITTAVL